MAACSPSDVATTVSSTYNMSPPTTWMIPGGKKVDIGGETVSIIGTDSCNTGFGGTYPCLLFSTVPGETQLVTLSNGLTEYWKTTDAGEGRIHLERPNGFKVIGK